MLVSPPPVCTPPPGLPPEQEAPDIGSQVAFDRIQTLYELTPPPVVAGLADGPAPNVRRKPAVVAGQDGTEKEDEEGGQGEEEYIPTADTAPIAATSLLPILTVRTPADSALCPICGEEIATPTACQTGVVYCYSCIYRWVDGVHPKQESFMKDKADRWESGKGRCAVTGRRVLGGTECLRRIMV